MEYSVVEQSYSRNLSVWLVLTC